MMTERTGRRVQHQRHRHDPHGRHAVGDADDRMIEQIAEGYAPRALRASRRVQLEEELWERIEKRRRRRYLTPVLAMATATAAVAMLALPWARQPEPGAAAGRAVGSSTVASESTEAYATWEYALLYPTPYASASAEVDPDRGLPDEYLGLAAVLADG